MKHLPSGPNLSTTIQFHLNQESLHDMQIRLVGAPMRGLQRYGATMHPMNLCRKSPIQIHHHIYVAYFGRLRSTMCMIINGSHYQHRLDCKVNHQMFRIQLEHLGLYFWMRRSEEMVKQVKTRPKVVR